MKRFRDDLLKKLNESWNRLEADRSIYGRKMLYHEHLLDVFSDVIIEEDEETALSRERVVQMIQNDEWEPQDPQRFYESLTSSDKHSEMLSVYSVDELAKMELFKVPNENIGFALKPIEGGKDIVSVHNHSRFKGLGDVLMDAAKRHGGTHLDHFHGFLTPLYDKAGFKPYKVDAYNPEYDQGGKFREKYGKMPVIYRSLHPQRKLTPQEIEIIRQADKEIELKKSKTI